MPAVGRRDIGGVEISWVWVREDHKEEKKKKASHRIRVKRVWP
jgi:hypothetical protein